MPGQAVADVVLGQEDLADPVPVPGLVLADPEDLGGGEAGQRGVGDQPDQRLAAAGLLLDLAALGGRALVVPEQGGADDLAVRRRGRPSRASGRSGRCPATSAGLNLPAARTSRDRLARRLPPELGVLLGPAGLGVVARILGRGRGQDRPALVDRERLGPRGPDVDAQRDAHGVISQRSPHRRTFGATPGGSRRASVSKTVDRDRVEGEHVVMMRHDEPGPDRGGQVDRLGRRHVPGHAPRGVAAVDRQEAARRTARARDAGQSVVGQAVPAMIEPQALGLDDEPQIKMTPGASVSSPSWAEGTARTRKPARSNACRRRRARRAGRPAAQASARARGAPRAAPGSAGEAASRSGKRPRVEVVGVLVAGQDQVDLAQVVAAERGAGHPDVRAARRLRISWSGAPRDKGRRPAGRGAT